MLSSLPHKHPTEIVLGWNLQKVLCALQVLYSLPRRSLVGIHCQHASSSGGRRPGRQRYRILNRRNARPVLCWKPVKKTLQPPPTSPGEAFGLGWRIFKKRKIVRVAARLCVGSAGPGRWTSENVIAAVTCLCSLASLRTKQGVVAIKTLFIFRWAFSAVFDELANRAGFENTSLKRRSFPAQSLEWICRFFTRNSVSFANCSLFTKVAFPRLRAFLSG